VKLFGTPLSISKELREFNDLIWGFLGPTTINSGN
jgi:hypothetical protein